MRQRKDNGIALLARLKYAVMQTSSLSRGIMYFTLAIDVFSDFAAEEGDADVFCIRLEICFCCVEWFLRKDCWFDSCGIMWMLLLL